jgi:hypothetical protein
VPKRTRAKSLTSTPFDSGSDTELPPEACDFFLHVALVARNDLGSAVRKDGRWNTFIVAPFQLHSNGSVTNDAVTALAENWAGNRSSVACVEPNARKRGEQPHRIAPSRRIANGCRWHLWKSKLHTDLVAARSG